MKLISIDKYGLWTPIGSLHFHEHYSWEPRFIWTRGRCEERILRIPIFKWAFEIEGRGKSYRQLVCAPKYLEDLSWVIDEFDSSFNALAIASLRYHLDFSVASNEDSREVFEDLIERLSEKLPTFTKEELAVLSSTDTGDLLADINRPSNPEQRAIREAHRERRRAHHERIQQARHDFVDIMPRLWS